MTLTPLEISQKPLRLWPGVVTVVLQWLLWFVLPFLFPSVAVFGMFGGLACGLVVLLWWLFLSRAPWAERVGAIVLMLVALPAAKRFVHVSIAGGMMGMLLFFYAVPVLSLGLVSWAVASRRLSRGPRRVAMVAAILVACGVFTLFRTGGLTGDVHSDFHWRWTRTPEERLLVQTGTQRVSPAPPIPAPVPPAAPPSTKAGDLPVTQKPRPTAIPQPLAPPEEPREMAAPEWSGFRGPGRDSIVRGVQIETDWSRSKPIELWRRPVGPGWSSFAVQGSLIYTQEQRGGDEVVSSYILSSGAPVWQHGDAVRFYESNGGAGPRSTPALGNGRVYALGATGILNALDARDGSVIWSRNAASDTQRKVPGWGFASSPLVVGDLVVVATAGVLAAYDVATGNPRWFGPTGGFGYSSPQLATIGGVAQVLLLNGQGAISVAPADGTLLWKHDWRGDSIVQPAVTTNGDVVIGSGSGIGVEVGLRRLAVAHGTEGWTVEERWTSTALKPYFNDFIIHKGHGFGFDGRILACINLEDGKRQWKGGRYGHGQLVVIPDQDLLLVLSEEGELALVKAVPHQFTELARVPAIEGKTWNHPALVGNILLVRNAEEMAAFRLAPASR